MATSESKTFFLLWDGSDEGYDPTELRHDIRATAQGRKVIRQWSFGQGHGDPLAGDRVFLQKTGTNNGIMASGHLVEDGVEWDDHWNPDHGGQAPYVIVEWDVVLELEDRLSYSDMKIDLPDFKLPIQSSGRRVYSPSDQHLEEAWARHIRSATPRRKTLGGGSDRGKGSGPVPREQHHTEGYEVKAFTSKPAVRREAALRTRFANHLLAQQHDVTGYRIVPKGEGTALYVDLYDRTASTLYEAKAAVSREAVRMALGQLLDYQRSVDPRPKLSVLLPERPSDDLLDLLKVHNITCVYEEQEGSFTSV